MSVREGGRYLADKSGKERRDPDDVPTRPIPAEGEDGYEQSAATPAKPEETAAEIEPAPDQTPAPATKAPRAKES